LLIRYLKNLLIGLLACLTFFMAVDLLLRFYLYKKYDNTGYLRFNITYKPTPEGIKIYGRTKEYNGYYKYIPGRFGMNDASLGASYVPFSINSLGFRGDEFSPQKKEGVFRICVMGGSATFGLEVGDNETCPFYLQQLLDKKRFPKKFEVINCGIPSYRMANIYCLFKNEVAGYQPDMIIVNSICNDCGRPAYSVKATIALKIHNLLYNRWVLYTLLLEKYSISLNLNKMPHPFFCYPGSLSDISDDYAHYLDLIIALAKERNIKIALVKEPMNFKNDDIKESYTIEQMDKEYIGAADFTRKTMVAYHYCRMRLTDIGSRNNIPVIDPSGPFSRRATLFIDIVHLYPKGYRLLASLIARGIRTQI